MIVAVRICHTITTSRFRQSGRRRRRRSLLPGHIRTYFQDLVDPVADDEELVDLIIEQATLLSKTILRYLMVMV
ncbi:hypothetical protein BIW11_07393 [Tropilaelaps mercedesae]|uniref:Uncharacterized protein n=1 Tax=Tropilaelaps mercedesae TaxID=418985 RepID=A0A1V9XU43_9ACAR|nr:hypothetical protein BIW11_07393 [Tropilaelaps mercedesae]